MILPPGFGLVVAPHFQLDDHWQERFWLSAGIEQTSAGILARRLWRCATAEELGVLIPSPRPVFEELNGYLCLFVVPVHIRSAFWNLLERAQMRGGIAAEDFNSFVAKIDSFLAFKELSLPGGAVFELVMNPPGQARLESASSLWGLIHLGEENARVRFLAPASETPAPDYPRLRLELAPGEGVRIPAGWAIELEPSERNEPVIFLLIRSPG